MGQALGQALGQVIRIKVTQEHIDKGQANGRMSHRCYTCPVALAFHDAGFPAAYVNGSRVSLQGEFSPSYMLPSHVRAFAAMADLLRPLSPIEFDFTVPEENQNATQA